MAEPLDPNLRWTSYEKRVPESVDMKPPRVFYSLEAFCFNNPRQKGMCHEKADRMSFDGSFFGGLRYLYDHPTGRKQMGASG